MSVLKLFFFEVIIFIIFVIILGIISAILGLFSRVLKFIFRKSGDSIDKGFLTLFTIISVVLVLIKGVSIVIESKNVFSADGHFWLKMLYFLFTQIWVSFLVPFGTYIFTGLSFIFYICSGSKLNKEVTFSLLGIPIFIFNLYHSIPIIAVIASFIF